MIHSCTCVYIMYAIEAVASIPNLVSNIRTLYIHIVTMYVRMYVREFMYVYVCIYCVYVYASLCVCVCVCVCVCIHTYVYNLYYHVPNTITNYTLVICA